MARAPYFRQVALGAGAPRPGGAALLRPTLPLFRPSATAAAFVEIDPGAASPVRARPDAGPPTSSRVPLVDTARQPSSRGNRPEAGPDAEPQPAALRRMLELATGEAGRPGAAPRSPSAAVGERPLAGVDHGAARAPTANGGRERVAVVQVEPPPRSVRSESRAPGNDGSGAPTPALAPTPPPARSPAPRSQPAAAPELHIGAIDVRVTPAPDAKPSAVRRPAARTIARSLRRGGGRLSRGFAVFGFGQS